MRKLACCEPMRLARAPDIPRVVWSNQLFQQRWLLHGQPFNFCPWCGARMPEATKVPRGEGISPLTEAKRAFERRYTAALLRICAGNVTRAARIAKRDRKGFYELLRRTGLSPASFRRTQERKPEHGR